MEKVKNRKKTDKNDKNEQKDNENENENDESTTKQDENLPFDVYPQVMDEFLKNCQTKIKRIKPKI